MIDSISKQTESVIQAICRHHRLNNLSYILPWGAKKRKPTRTITPTEIMREADMGPQSERVTTPRRPKALQALPRESVRGEPTRTLGITSGTKTPFRRAPRPAVRDGIKAAEAFHVVRYIKKF